MYAIEKAGLSSHGRYLKGLPVATSHSIGGSSRAAVSTVYAEKMRNERNRS
jgi:hypothetical protein